MWSFLVLVGCAEGDGSVVRAGQEPAAGEDPHDPTPGDSSPPTDTGATALPTWTCATADLSMRFAPAPVDAATPLDVSITGDTGYVYVDLAASGPGSATVTWGGVTGSGPYTWGYVVTGLSEGTWTFRFTADSGATPLCEAEVPVTGTWVDPPAGALAVSGAGFTLDGAPFRFVGMNTRGLVHYGGADLLPYTSSADVTTTLDAAAASGARVLRVFAANRHLDPATAADRLATTLDAAHARGLFVIVALTDYYPTGFNPPGDEGWYAVDPNGYTVLSHDWFVSGYTTNYLPWLRAAVDRNAGHPALFAWELGNELKDPWYPETYVAWAQAVAAELRARDPATLVTTGLISTSSAALSTDQASRLHAAVDFMTVHLYDGAGDGDVALAASLGLPILVEEAGFSGDGRGAAVRAHAESLFGQGADGYLQWGLMATTGDNGDGDRTYGMDRVFHGDWEELQSTYATLASGL